MAALRAGDDGAEDRLRGEVLQLVTIQQDDVGGSHGKERFGRNLVKVSRQRPLGRLSQRIGWATIGT